MKLDNLIGAKQGDLKEAYELGVITEAEYKLLEPTSIKPHKEEVWVSYMPRSWRKDYRE